MSVKQECQRVMDELSNVYSNEQEKSNGELHVEFQSGGKIIYKYYGYPNGQSEWVRIASESEINNLLKKNGSNYRIGSGKTSSWW